MTLLSRNGESSTSRQPTLSVKLTKNDFPSLQALYTTQLRYLLAVKSCLGTEWLISPEWLPFASVERLSLQPRKAVL